METTTAAAGEGHQQQNQNQQPSYTSIRMVVQRYRKANVLIDESKVMTVGGNGGNSTNDTESPSSSLLEPPPSSTSSSVGLLAYLSFAKTATPKHVEQAAMTLLNLPVLTLGGWGDGSTPQSMLQLLTTTIEAKRDDDDEKTKENNLSVAIIPQANLVSKVKKQGKSIQYHGQISKDKGEELYNLFVDTVHKLLNEHEQSGRNINNNTNNKDTATNKPSASSTIDPSIPPSEIFKVQSDLYSTFDEQGFPLTTKDGDNYGNPITKSARKKLQKIYNGHVKRHEKFLKEGGSSTSSVDGASISPKEPETTTVVVEKEEAKKQPENSSTGNIVKVVAGSFGKRQGIEIFSDMGIFCHVVEL